MSRDYAKKRLSPRSGKPAASSSGFAGLLTGIFIGFIIAGIFYLHNQKSSLTLAKLPAVENTPENKAGIPKTAAVSPPEVKNNPQALQTQFDFYNVLPSQKVIGPSGDEDMSNIQVKLPPSNPEADAPDNPAPSSPAADSTENDASEQTGVNPLKSDDDSAIKTKDKTNSESIAKLNPDINSPSMPAAYILQIAAFGHMEEADALKAQLALLGFDVKIGRVRKNGKNLNRVFLGPFESSGEAESMQKQLQENMIKSQLLKSRR